MNQNPLSLIPYFEKKGGGFFLELTLARDENSLYRDHPAYPFAVEEDSNPYALMIRGRLAIDSASPVIPLLFLKQKDLYQEIGDTLHPLTNSWLESLWHGSINFFASSGAGRDAFLFPHQTADKEPQPFKSLFFCKERRIFFHPPCPECGSELTLCRDDHLLLSYSLPPFSTSLKQFLYCPVCQADSNRPMFFQYEKNEFPLIPDRFDLVRSFNRLKGDIPGLPCLTCPLHAECHMTSEKALSRIFFFAFYPFHLILFQGDSHPASSYLRQISGGPAMAGIEIEPWDSRTPSPPMHQNCTFYPPDDPHYFMELLFLKLSFFKRLSQLLVDRIRESGNGDIAFPISGIRVGTINKETLIPSLWQVRITIAGPIENARHHAFGRRLTRASSAHFLASLWFVTFLINKKQNINQVYETLDRLIRYPGLEQPGELRRRIQLIPELAPQNIFWNPDAQNVPPEGMDCWIRIMETGLSMETWEMDTDLLPALAEWMNNMEQLRKEAFQSLFAGTIQPVEDPRLEATQFEPPPHEKILKPGSTREKSDRSAIAEILKKFQSNRLSSPPQDDDILETVVLSEDTLQSMNEETRDAEPIHENSPPGKIQPTNQEQEHGFDEMEKTLVMNPVPPSSPPAQEFENMEKTVVIHGNQTDRPLEQKRSPDFENMEETVIINLDRQKKGTSP